DVRRHEPLSESVRDARAMVAGRAYSRCPRPQAVSGFAVFLYLRAGSCRSCAMSNVEKSLYWPVISERNSFHNSLGILRKTSTTAGSNWVPEQRNTSWRAASKLLAAR